MTRKPPEGGTQNSRLKIMYLWRKMSERQREDALKYRRTRRFPKHSPPHFEFEGEHQYIITAVCYEHAHIIGKSPDRMTDCETKVLEICENLGAKIYAWCILPNHYHVLLKTENIQALRKELGLGSLQNTFSLARAVSIEVCLLRDEG